MLEYSNKISNNSLTKSVFTYNITSNRSLLKRKFANLNDLQISLISQQVRMTKRYVRMTKEVEIADISWEGLIFSCVKESL